MVFILLSYILLSTTATERIYTMGSGVSFQLAMVAKPRESPEIVRIDYVGGPDILVERREPQTEEWKTREFQVCMIFILLPYILLSASATERISTMGGTGRFYGKLEAYPTWSRSDARVLKGRHSIAWGQHAIAAQPQVRKSRSKAGEWTFSNEQISTFARNFSYISWATGRNIATHKAVNHR